MDKEIRVVQGANGVMTCGKILSKLDHLGPTGGMGGEGKKREGNKERALEREALPSL